MLPPEAEYLAQLDLARAARLGEADAIELACKAHLGVWGERKRGQTHGGLHWEWSELAMRISRLAVIAPREHAKTETFTVNQIAWRATYNPGFWCYVFCQTGDQAKQLKERIDNALLETAPWMIAGEHGMNSVESVYANWSRVNVAGAGKAVRSVHPDLVVGDDVLEEGNCLTSLQRRKMHRWWFGTVAGLAHPGTVRVLGELEDEATGKKKTLVRSAEPVRVAIGATKIHAVGTPFHQQDLLLSMRDNPLYVYRRYAAEFDAGDLVPGTLAVEAA
jgi:hypothetical protein